MSAETKEEKAKKQKALGNSLRRQGFDLTRYDRSEQHLRVRCSQCQAMVVNGTPIMSGDARMKNDTWERMEKLRLQMLQDLRKAELRQRILYILLLVGVIATFVGIVAIFMPEKH